MAYNSNLSVDDLQDNRNERIAIMCCEGMPEEEAQAFCDTRPELYGTRPEIIKEVGQ